jgi:hypothetical protein
MIMFLTLLFTCLAFFGLCEFGHAIQTPIHPSIHALFPERLICTKFDAVLLLDPSQNRIRPDT